MKATKEEERKEEERKEKGGRQKGEKGRRGRRDTGQCLRGVWSVYLEPLGLQDLLNGHDLLAVDETSLIHHAEGTVPDHLDVRVGHFLWTVRPLARRGHHCRDLAAVS